MYKTCSLKLRKNGISLELNHEPGIGRVMHWLILYCVNVSSYNSVKLSVTQIFKE